MTKYSRDGVPKCKECGKFGERLFVNKETLEDYHLCTWCAFKRKDFNIEPTRRHRSHDDVVLEKRAKKIRQVQKKAIYRRLKEDKIQKRKERAMNTVDLLDSDFSKFPLEKLRQIRHQLYARRNNSKDVKIQKKYTKRIELLKTIICGKAKKPKVPAPKKK